MQRFLFLWVDVPCSGGSKVFILIYPSGYTRDTKPVQYGSNGAVDMKLALKARGTGSNPVWDDNFLFSSMAKMVGESFKMQDCIMCNRRAVTGNIFDSHFEGQQEHMSGAAQASRILNFQHGNANSPVIFMLPRSQRCGTQKSVVPQVERKCRSSQYKVTIASFSWCHHDIKCVGMDHKKSSPQMVVDPVLLAFEASVLTCFEGKHDQTCSTCFQGKWNFHCTIGATLHQYCFSNVARKLDELERTGVRQRQQPKGGRAGGQESEDE